MKDQNEHSLAVITGSSSGIGLELARCFARDHHDLVLVAEDGPGLEAAAVELRAAGSADVYVIVADLAQPDRARLVYDEIIQSGREPDVLVNNAGVGVYGKFIETSLAEELAMVQLNTVATVQLTKLFAPRMARRGRGRILFTASVASVTPTPYLAVYGATKAFLYEFAQGLREELKADGVTVTALMPGPTDTNFFERAHAMDSKIVDGKLADPADVAAEGYAALMRGDDKVIAPWRDKVRTTVSTVLPDPVLAKQALKKHEPKHDAKSDAERDERRP